MPNWCYTRIGFNGKTRDINRLFEKMREYTTFNNKTETGFIKNDFGKEWLGNLAIGFGMDDMEIPCRGSIYDLAALETKMPNDPEEEIIRTIETETAWGPCDKLFNAIMENYPEIYYARKAQEPNMNIFLNNDEEGIIFPEKYILDTECDGYMEYETFEELIKQIEQMLIYDEKYASIRENNKVYMPDIKVHNFKALKAEIAKFNNSLDSLGLDDAWDFYINIHEYENA